MSDSSLVKAAIKEQIKSSMSWFSGIRGIIDNFDNGVQSSDYEKNTSPFLNALQMADLCTPSDITANLKNIFINSWKASLSNSSKLSFYCSVKEEFRWELYLDSVQSFNERRATSQIRSSSHKLNIETGRYAAKAREDRICDFCSKFCSSSSSSYLPIEDEHHFLNICPQGASIRSSYINHLQRLLPNEPGEPVITPSISGALLPPPFQLHPSSTSPNIKQAKSIIRLACNTIYRLYDTTLKFKKKLKDASKVKSKPNAPSASAT